MSDSVVAAITNAKVPGEDPVRPSRGLLVREILSAPAASEARERLEEMLRRDAYNGFNLLVADAHEAWVATRSEAPMKVRELGPGSWVLDNHEPGSRHVLSPLPGGQMLRCGMEGGSAEDVLRRVAVEALASHEPLSPTDHVPCRHGERRGTVACSLLYLDPLRPGRSFFLFAPGPPCATPFDSYRLPRDAG
jgi:hypothetical protein